jgi:hypothetical protein
LPNFPSLATCCADLELRPLPSIGITPISTVLRTYPPPHRIRPVPRGRPGGRRNRPSDGASLNCDGLPLIRMPSPVPRQNLWVRVAHYPRNGSLPRNLGGSASALDFSRIAQRSLKLWPTYSSSRLCDPLHQRLQPLRHLHDCSGYYRLEQQLPDGLAPTKRPRLLLGARDSPTTPASSCGAVASTRHSCMPLGRRRVRSERVSAR